MNPTPPQNSSAELPSATPTVQRNRLLGVLQHIPYYTFRGTSRLAKDAKISSSSLSRVLRGETQPTLGVALSITAALEKRLNVRIDPRELFSLDKDFQPKSVCELVGCPGCLPAQAYGEDNQILPEYADVQPGAWSLNVGKDRMLPSRYARNEGQERLAISVESAKEEVE